MKKSPSRGSLPGTRSIPVLDSAKSLRASWRTLALLAAITASWAVVPRGIAEEGGSSARPAPESAGPEYRSATEAQQIELLRRLLGVQTPKPAAVPEPASSPHPSSAPPSVQPVSVSEPAPTKAAEKAAERAEKKARPVAKPKPKAKPVTAKKAGSGAAVAEPEASPAETEEPVSEEAATPAPASPPPAPVAEGKAGAGTKTASYALPGTTSTDLPPVGTVITEANSDRWTDLLTPSLRWSLQHGARMQIVAPQTIELEPPRAAATEQYHQQVTLSADKKTLVNFVAGTPFPDVTERDPDAAIKLIFNFENRVMFDDVDGRNFGCITGKIQKEGVEIERNYRIGHFRRLFYTGRFMVDPKPTWKTGDGIRYRENLSPINEPFDYKGAGFSYSRYLDPARQDDSWLYYPQTKRVRRLSTAQRSEGVFGQDVDLDSYAGFAGNPAWFDWKLLGKKTLLAPFHVIHQPVKWMDKPADFMFDDAWEPREMYILAARSLLAGYNFSLRIIYVDAQSFLIPYTEVYDNDGQLWRAYVQQWKCGVDRMMPFTKDPAYPFKTNFLQALTVFDMQQEHTTRCEFPAADAPKEETWVYWRGNDGGSRPEDFDVANFINAGR